MKKNILSLMLLAVTTSVQAQDPYDLNKDGQVNIGDVTTLVNRILGKDTPGETTEDITDVVIPVTNMYDGSYTDGALLYSIMSPITREALVLGVKNNKITDVIIPKGIEIDGITYTVTTIGEKAFYGSEDVDVRKCLLPKSIKTIGEYAFAHSDLKEITLPNNITDIAFGAFCCIDYLENVTAKRTNPKEYNANSMSFLEAFSVGYPPHSKNYDDVTLHVPAGCKTAYENCEPWRYFGTIIDDATTE